MTIAEEVLKIVHAFSDEGRRESVRALAEKIGENEREVHRLREECRMLASYLGHQDQDANHEWMFRRLRAAGAGLPPPDQDLGKREAPFLDLVKHLERQRRFSLSTFGPGDARDRVAGLVDHIAKELREILAEPNDLEEWIDVAILAFDGAWRTGASPELIAGALRAKLAKNEARQWPDWRTAEPGKAIEHLRGERKP